MADHIDDIHHGGVDIETFTPLPEHVHKVRRWKQIFFMSLVPIAIVLIGGLVYMRYQEYLSQKGSIGTVTDERPPTATPIPSVTPTEVITGVPMDWSLKKSQTCGITFAIPPDEEPYIIPRDPNTQPSSTDEEGNYWMYEESDSELFMFDNMVRAIFKNPERVGSGYVSAAVEVYCSENSEGYTTDELMKTLETSLNENFSVIKVKEILDDQKWGIPVKMVRFQGGTFGNEQYYLLATDSHIYLIRSFGGSSNSDVTAVRDQIFAQIRFE